MKLVYVENDRPLTDSLIVAETFGKTHDKVLRDIRELGCSDRFRVANFGDTPYVHEQNGQVYTKYLITEQGFTILVMGYTGTKAMKYKEDYINEFTRMREELNKPRFDLPQTKIEAVKAYLQEMEKNELLETEKQLLLEETQTQKQVIKDQAPKIAIYDLAIAAGNTQSMQVVAKALGTGRTRLFDQLREHNIIMKNSRIPYQRYIDAGYFEVKESPRQQGDVIVNEPVTKVTAKGFEYIAKLLKGTA